MGGLGQYRGAPAAGIASRRAGGGNWHSLDEGFYLRHVLGEGVPVQRTLHLSLRRQLEVGRMLGDESFQGLVHVVHAGAIWSRRVQVGGT